MIEHTLSKKIAKLKKDLADSNRKNGFYSHTVVDRLVETYDALLSKYSVENMRKVVSLK